MHTRVLTPPPKKNNAEPIFDVTEEKYVQKVVFAVFFTGDRSRQKIDKICDSFKVCVEEGGGGGGDIALSVGLCMRWCSLYRARAPARALSLLPSYARTHLRAHAQANKYWLPEDSNELNKLKSDLLSKKEDLEKVCLCLLCLSFRSA